MLVKLLKETRFGPFGKKVDYKLLNHQYGQWVIFEKNDPLYYLNIFDEQDPSSVKVKQLLENKGWSLNLFLHRVNMSQGLTLTLQPKHFGLLILKEEIEIELASFPLEYINALEGPYCDICVQGEIVDFESQTQFDALEKKIHFKLDTEDSLKQVENISEKRHANKKYYKFYCDKCKDFWVLKDPSFPDKGFFIRTRG